MYMNIASKLTIYYFDYIKKLFFLHKNVSNFHIFFSKKIFLIFLFLIVLFALLADY